MTVTKKITTEQLQRFLKKIIKEQMEEQRNRGTDWSGPAKKTYPTYFSLEEFINAYKVVRINLQSISEDMEKVYKNKEKIKPEATAEMEKISEVLGDVMIDARDIYLRLKKLLKGTDEENRG